MRRVLMMAFTLLATGCLFAQTGEKPNFSGVWRMVKEKSDFGKVAMPDRILRTIDHRGVTINVHTEQEAGGRTSSTDLLYYTDGRDSTNEVSGREGTYHCFWDGGTLVIRTEAKTKSGRAALTEERWTLEPDGNTLTMTSHVRTSGFEADFKMVCERVKGK